MFLTAKEAIDKERAELERRGITTELEFRMIVFNQKTARQFGMAAPDQIHPHRLQVPGQRDLLTSGITDFNQSKYGLMAQVIII